MILGVARGPFVHQNSNKICQQGVGLLSRVSLLLPSLFTGLFHDLSALLAMTSITHAVGGSVCFLCRSITIFDQCHDGFVVTACNCLSHLECPEAAPAVSFCQFVMIQHHGHIAQSR
jgi:hypothetical protein